MKVRIILSCATAAAAMGLGVAPAHAASFTSCGEVSFSGGAVADSNYGATNIRALRTPCGTAKAVATAVQNAHNHRYVSHGFSCAGHLTGGGYSAYACTKTDNKGIQHKVQFTGVGLG